MTPYDKRQRWPFLDESKTIHVSGKNDIDGERTEPGIVTVLDAPTLEPEHFRRLSISDSMPLEAYAPTRGEE
jgi:hypothetical protein